MALLPIITAPDSRLREISQPVDAVDDTVRKLLDDMLETMYAAPGVGLSAIQVGVAQRVVVIDTAKDPYPPDPVRMINPEIIWQADEIGPYEEGCLSIPEQYGEVDRPAEIDMQWLGLDGKTHTQRFDGLWATCAQHELDHLNGKLFIDYLKPMRRQLITRKMQKLKREQARS